MIKPATGDVIGIDAFTIDTTTAWVKTYAANGVTCGTGTPKARYFIPGNTNGGGFISLPVTPDLYPGGITVCITGGYADNDTTAPTASKMVVNVHWQ